MGLLAEQVALGIIDEWSELQNHFSEKRMNERMLLHYPLVI